MSIGASAKIPQEAQAYITLRAASRGFGISYKSLRQMAKDGNLPSPRRVGRRWMYSPDDLATVFPEAARRSGSLHFVSE